MTSKESAKLRRLAWNFSQQGKSVAHWIQKNERKKAFERCASQLLHAIDEIEKGNKK